MADAIRETQPHVDVILPTHCGLAWVDEAIGSVLEQTHESLSLIAIDDASDDGTFAHVCERWSHDPRVTALALETSQRAAGARMQALEAGDGEWLAFIDQDDRWRPEKLARQLQRAAAEPRADAVHTDCTHIAADGSPPPTRRSWCPCWQTRFATAISTFTDPLNASRNLELRVADHKMAYSMSIARKRSTRKSIRKRTRVGRSSGRGADRYSHWTQKPARRLGNS